MDDFVLWLGGNSLLKDLVAAQYRVVDGPPAAGRFSVIAEGGHTAAALRLALERPKEVAAVALLAPILLDATGRATDEALAARFGTIEAPLLALFGTKDAAAPPEAGRHYRERNARCNVVFVYDAGAAMGDERPEAVAELVLDFLHRGDKFLVRQEDDLLYR